MKLQLSCVLLAVLCGWGSAGGGEPDVVVASGVKAGLCVHLGAGDGELMSELAGGGKFVVHGLAADAAGAAKAREHIVAKGLYGPASVDAVSLKRLPYAQNLVNLVVAENVPGLKGLSLEEVARVLVPNGAFCFKGAVDAAKLKAAGLTPARKSGAWSVSTKPWPKDMGEWPCFDYSPEGNPVSKDLAVGPGTSLRWRVPMYSRHCISVIRDWVSAGGRVFYSRRALSADGYRVKYFLEARDAFNGKLLWKRPLAGHVGAKYGDWSIIATSDRLYLPLERKGPVVALDVATGEELKKFDAIGRPTSMLLHEGRMLCSTWSTCWAVDMKTGKRLWHDKRQGGAMVVSGGKLYSFSYPRELRCMDPATGKVEWKVSTGPEDFNKYNSPFHYKGALVLVKALRKPRYGLRVEGYSAKDGKKLWGGIPESNSILRRGGCYMGEVFGAQGLVWIHAVVKKDPARKNAGKRPSAWLGVDPGTGEIKKRYDDATSVPEVSKMLANGTHRCNRGRATERGYLFGTNEFFEWKTGKYHSSSATRSNCGVGTGMLPANGLIYAPPPTCICRQFMERGGFAAFSHRPGGVKEDDAGRLIKGPGSGATGVASASEWACYRKNAARLGASDVAVAAGVAQLWERKLGAGLTAPVIAGGRVLVASGVDHRVSALDANSGKVLWSFTAGGRIDSPPTLSGGLAVFGCRDGWVYCLSASSGKLVWKYRLAPVEERVMVDGQLESAWPVHGSLPVVNGVAYAAAGWHTALDGGVTLAALKVGSGEVVWKKRLEKLPGPMRFADVPVALLTSDGKYLCMGRKRFDLATGAEAKSARVGRVVSFGRSSFRDSDWARSSNSKGALRWSDGRASGELLSSGKNMTYGISVSLRGRDDGSLLGVGAHKLFGSTGKGKPGWSVAVPLLPRAAVLCGKVLFAAGSPDPEIAELKGIKDRRRKIKVGAEFFEKNGLPKGGELWVVSAADGKKLHSLKLPSPPVFDGMASAGGRLYFPTQDGVMRCFGKK